MEVQQGFTPQENTIIQDQDKTLQRFDQVDVEYYQYNALQTFYDQNSSSQNNEVKVIGGENNIQKDRKRGIKTNVAPPLKMICVQNSVLENEVFPIIVDENIDPDDLNKKINYGLTWFQCQNNIVENFSKMDAKLVKMVQSKMKIEAMKKRQIQYQLGIQRQMNEKYAKNQQSRNLYLEHRIKNCQKKSQKWQERKSNHDNFMLEKEILKQIMQDEYLLTQQEFWSRREGQSQNFDIKQNLNKSTQIFQRNNTNTTTQTIKPQKESERPDTSHTVISFIQNNSRQQKRLQKIESDSEQNESIKSISLIGDRIGSNRIQTNGNFNTSTTNKRQASQTFYYPSQNQKQINYSLTAKKENKIQNQNQSENYKQSHRINTLTDQNQDTHSRSMIQSESDNQQQGHFNNSILSEINIQRDFYIQNPYTRSIIKDSLTQINSKKNLSLDQNSLTYDNQTRQYTPLSNNQLKPRFSNYLKTPTTLNTQITPNNMFITQQKFQNHSPEDNSNISLKKKDQKLSYDKRRYKCLNKIYECKVNQLNQDEVFSDKMRKQKLQDLVRKKISANFPGNYKLKINFSLVEKLDNEDDHNNTSQYNSNQILKQTLQEQSYQDNAQKLHTNKQWSNHSQLLNRNRVNHQKEGQYKINSHSFNLYNNEHQADENE